MSARTYREVVVMLMVVGADKQRFLGIHYGVAEQKF